MAACGNNQNKKAEAVVEEEATEACCGEKDACCGEECEGECCGENCEHENNE